MASTSLLISRLQNLVRYGQWSPNDAVDLFTALVKEYSVRRIETDFYTWMAKKLYQVEIHKINKSDLTLEPSQNVDGIEDRINALATETKEKSLKQILDEIRAEGKIDPSIVREVENIVSYVSSSPPCPVSNNPPSLKEKLVRLCNAVYESKKYNPRLTQMVSWCIMVLSDSSQLIQVGTGEGKSCIVAMFAAYLALNGQNVDIISSSPVLAERDAKEWLSFYKNLGITVDFNTNKQKVEDLRKCYACQVVYGTTQDFAGDWLRQRFQRENVRPGRKFQSVIVDEVDSLMLDKGLEVVYLNSEMPVMETLNVILARIWFVVNQTEDLDVEKTVGLIRSLMKDDFNLLPSLKYSDILKDTSQIQCSESHIPGFLDHINKRLKIWIENAVLAKNMILGHEYILHEGGVIPVDYRSTGVVQNNMKWGDGLQQFLEMKHQARLSNMCIITNFKSNVSLFRSYERIFGLTGTLGNQSELDLLQKLYPGIKTCKIPSFKPRKLYEIDGIVSTDEDGWLQTICEVVNKKVNSTVFRGSRAVLVICETIKRAQTVHDALSKSIPTGKLKLYTNNNMDNSKVTEEKVTEGCVIVATNLAGRGTDLKVCKEVNASGGLFVVQTFLPLNSRVEQQAFGRTAREGNPGSAQLIMCSTHFSESVKLIMVLQSPLRLMNLLRHLKDTLAVSGFSIKKFEDSLKICQRDLNETNCEAMVTELRKLLNTEKPSDSTNIEMEKKSRDLIVQTRLSHILEDDIPKITKKEDLFSEYLDMLDTIYEQPQRDNHEDIVSSLHECWGMWLLMKFNENESTEILRKQLQKDLQSAKKKLDCKQSPSSMIYHYVRTGNTLRNKGSIADSIQMYTRAIENNPCWPAIALYNRALSILSKGNSGHIAQALADLKKAEKAVDSHIRHLTLTLILVKDSSKDPGLSSDKSFTKQFEAKQIAQQLFKNNIQRAIEVLETAESKGYDVRITEYPAALLELDHVLCRSDKITEVIQLFVALSKLSQALLLESSRIGLSTESRLTERVTELDREIVQLHLLGLDTLFSVQTVFSFFKRLSKIFS